MNRPAPEVTERMEALLGRTAPAWARVTSRGYALGERWLVGLSDGSRVFLKVGISPSVADNLRAEHVVYEQLEAPFLPRLVAWDDGNTPLLVLEDLSGARWPPPWTPGDIESVLATVDDVAATAAPRGLPQLESVWDPGWAVVAEAPDPFLGLSLVSEAWLGEALPSLLDAERATRLHGDQLVHCDLRSDNLCLRDGRAVLVDWNLASVGSSDFDPAFWLPSLVLEHGMTVTDLVARRPSLDAFAAFVAGFFACRAGLEPPPGAPAVRGFQLAQLRVALPWAARTLGLPPPDGIAVAG